MVLACGCGLAGSEQTAQQAFPGDGASGFGRSSPIELCVGTARVVPAAGGMEAATREAVVHTDTSYAFAPGYDPQEKGRAFLPIGLALSFFFIWPFAGAGSPASMVRVMAGQSTEVLRRSMVVLCLYNLLIYIPLVMICIAGRALLPDVSKTDEIVPTLRRTLPYVRWAQDSMHVVDGVHRNPLQLSAMRMVAIVVLSCHQAW